LAGRRRGAPALSLAAAQKLCARVGEQLAGDEEGREDLLAGLRMYMGQPDMVRWPACLALCFAILQVHLALILPPWFVPLKACVL
jgi:hypothetical protein